MAEWEDPTPKLEKWADQRIAELEAALDEEHKLRQAQESVSMGLTDKLTAAKKRVEELEREKERREAWWKRRIAEHQQAERDYLAEVRRLEGLIATFSAAMPGTSERHEAEVSLHSEAVLIERRIQERKNR